jgi:hypothetical protein
VGAAGAGGPECEAGGEGRGDVGGRAVVGGRGDEDAVDATGGADARDGGAGPSRARGGADSDDSDADEAEPAQAGPAQDTLTVLVLLPRHPPPHERARDCKQHGTARSKRLRRSWCAGAWQVGTWNLGGRPCPAIDLTEVRGVGGA